MSNVSRRIRARVRDGRIELLEPAQLPQNDEEFTVTIETSARPSTPIEQVLESTAGAWTDENHPKLVTRFDVVQVIGASRAEFSRGYGA